VLLTGREEDPIMSRKELMFSVCMFMIMFLTVLPKGFSTGKRNKKSLSRALKKAIAIERDNGRDAEVQLYVKISQDYIRRASNLANVGKDVKDEMLNPGTILGLTIIRYPELFDKVDFRDKDINELKELTKDSGRVMYSLKFLNNLVDIIGDEIESVELT